MAAKPYASVPSRYLTPTKRQEEPSPEQQKKTRASSPAPREQFATDKKWQEVSPRYELPVEPRPQPKPINTSKPLEHWKEIDQHRALAAKMKLDHVGPKFMEHLENAASKEDSPRRMVERAREAAHAQLPGKPWQSTTAVHKARTFEELLPQYYAAHAELAPPAPGTSKVSKGALSSVGEYIRSGSPIRHHRGTTDHHERVRKTKSPTPFRSPGVRQDTFAALQNATKKRPEFMREEIRVREDREARAQKTVPLTFTPRVAKLAPAYSIAHVPDSATSVASASPSPSREKRSVSR